ncbi:MAG: Hsp20/alpha crystallin family protein [Chloroflexi bacterium]|nr:Hsp20/alpha crystallin family protein [Chloroflexota bacterium]
MKKDPDQSDLSGLLGGSLNVLGIKLDLGRLLASPEDLRGQLETLRERLRAAGGKEVLSDEAWQAGGVSVSGHIRTGGILGEQEYHIGSVGHRTAAGRSRAPARPSSAPPSPASPSTEVVEPPVDVFFESDEVVVVADVPGAGLEELDIRVEGDTLSIASKSPARRAYAKQLSLGTPVDPSTVQATCRNGVLEIRLRRPPSAQASGDPERASDAGSAPGGDAEQDTGK